MKRNAATLVQVGRALFGVNWQTGLGDALEPPVHPRTVRRWGKGEFTIPDGIWPELAALCITRANELRATAAKLAAKP